MARNVRQPRRAQDPLREVPRNVQKMIQFVLPFAKAASIIHGMDENIPFIDQIVQTIVSTAAPEKIILFGSYARGDNRQNSDVDILILKKGLKNERELTNRLYIDFFDRKIPTPVDLLAIDYNRYNELNDDIGYIYKTIKREGKTLYEYI